MVTINYGWSTPTVGGSEDTWGTDILANLAALDTLLGGTNATEFAILKGATVTTAELNKLDGVTASTAELNILDGVTATAADLNKTDGLTATTAELNFTDGVTSAIQTQINTKAALASPALTGNPTAPTQSAGNNTTRLATTAFVAAATTELQIRTSLAAASVGEIGTYAYLRHDSSTSEVNPGDTVDGSNFRYSDGNFSKSATAPSGSWRCMGYASNRSYPTLYMRVA